MFNFFSGNNTNTAGTEEEQNDNNTNGSLLAQIIHSFLYLAAWASSPVVALTLPAPEEDSAPERTQSAPRTP